MKVLEAVDGESRQLLMVLREMLSIMEPFGEEQGQHALRTWCAYWTLFNKQSPRIYASHSLLDDTLSD